MPMLFTSGLEVEAGNQSILQLPQLAIHFVRAINLSQTHLPRILVVQGMQGGSLISNVWNIRVLIVHMLIDILNQL